MLQSTTTPTKMGEISFIQMFYWIITTIATVGYGDFAPKNNISQLTVAVFIIAGVTFFSVQTGEIVKLTEEMSAGRGVYEGKTRHIIVVGSGVGSFGIVLQNFLAEILASKKPPNILLMDAADKPDAIAKYLCSSACRGKVLYFQGL